MLVHRLLSAILVLTSLTLPLPALAQANPAAPGQAKAPAPSAAWSDGVVRTIYKQEGRITISHGPLVNLGMGQMTMTFRVTAPALFEGLKEGSRIRFVAENVNGELTVTALQPAK